MTSWFWPGLLSVGILYPGNDKEGERDNLVKLMAICEGMTAVQLRLLIRFAEFLVKEDKQ